MSRGDREEAECNGKRIWDKIRFVFVGKGGDLMADAQLWMDADRASLQRANRYDEYANRLYVARSLTWKSPPTCEPTWKDQFEHALEASSSLEERPRPDVLNAAIDKIYDELAELVARRSDRPDSALEKRISTCFQRLRELQKQ